MLISLEGVQIRYQDLSIGWEFHDVDSREKLKHTHSRVGRGENYRFLEKFRWNTLFWVIVRLSPLDIGYDRVFFLFRARIVIQLKRFGLVSKTELWARKWRIKRQNSLGKSLVRNLHKLHRIYLTVGTFIPAVRRNYNQECDISPKSNKN